MSEIKTLFIVLKFLIWKRDIVFIEDFSPHQNHREGSPMLRTKLFDIVRSRIILITKQTRLHMKKTT
jgi:hypothetical protein